MSSFLRIVTRCLEAPLAALACNMVVFLSKSCARLRCLTVYFAALVLSNVALAYDFRKMEAALESLTPETQRMWEQKALAGDALAQNVTGMAYKYGRFGVPQDHAASIKWFRMAAEQGEADAQFNLARIYGKAEGIYRRARAAPQNDAEAFKWYRLSAEQGHTLAQVKLAEMYAEGGSNIPRDLVQAYKWISIAAASGNPTAAKLLTTYAAEMTDQQVKKAESLAQEWRNRHR